MNYLDFYCASRRPLAYICCGGSAKVAIVDLENASHIGDIPCGAGSDPYYIAISPNKWIAYVADYTQQKILMLDLIQNQVVGQTALSGHPRGIDISPLTQNVYVVFDDVPVMQILAPNLCSRGQMELPSAGGSVVVAADSVAFVALPLLNQTAVIDLCTCAVIDLLDTGISPGRMAYHEREDFLLVAGRGSQTLTPVNTRGYCIGEDIPLGGTPAGLAFIQGRPQCLVALQNENQAAVVDLCSRQVSSLIPVGQLPGGVAASEKYPFAIVCNQISSTVSIIQTQALAVTATLAVGDDPAGVAVIC